MTVDGSANAAANPAAPVRNKIVNNEHLAEERAKQGVLLLDVYSKWAGPCEAVQGIFRKFKQEFGELLTIYPADAEVSEAFKRFRDQSMPAFLFYANGVLTQVVRGANGPLLDQVLREQISLVKAGDVPTPLYPEDKWSFPNAYQTKPQTASLSAPRPQSRPSTTNLQATNITAFVLADSPEGQEYTLGLVKPNAIENAEAIRQRILQTPGLKIVHEKWVVLTRDQAGVIYAEHKTKPFYQNLISFVTCGPILAMALQGEKAVERWRKLMGSANPKKAQQEDPMSLRALYGVDNLHNATHGSDTPNVAREHIQFLFSANVQSPEVPPTTPIDIKVKGNRTIVVLKPDFVKGYTLPFVLPAFRTGAESVLQMQGAGAGKSRASLHTPAAETAESYSAKALVNQFLYHVLISGYRVDRMEEKTLIPEQHLKGLASIHDWNWPIDGQVVEEWTRGPSILLSLAGDHVSELCPLMVSRLPFDIPKNSIYVPADMEVAHRALDVFYPHAPGSTLNLAHLNASQILTQKENTVALIKPDVFATSSEAIVKKIKENDFTIVKEKEVTFTKEMAKKLYKDLEDKPFFGELIDFISSGPCLALVLNRDNGVQAWRELIGPVDAATAKQTYPNTLRAIYGQDNIHNAVYGSDSVHSASRDLQLLFPEIEPLTQIRPSASMPRLSRSGSKTNLPASSSKSNLPTSSSKPQLSSTSGASASRPGSAAKSNPAMAKPSGVSRPSSAAKNDTTSKSQLNGASAVSASKSQLTSSKAKLTGSAAVSTSKSQIASSDVASSKAQLATSGSKAQLASSPAATGSTAQLAASGSKAQLSGSKAQLASTPETKASKAQLSGSKPQLASGTKTPVSGSKPQLASQSKLSSSKPALSASKPALSGSKPALSGSKPALSASKPALSSSKAALEKTPASASKPQLASGSKSQLSKTPSKASVKGSTQSVKS